MTELGEIYASLDHLAGDLWLRAALMAVSYGHLTDDQLADLDTLANGSPGDQDGASMRLHIDLDNLLEDHWLDVHEGNIYYLTQD